MLSFVTKPFPCCLFLLALISPEPLLLSSATHPLPSFLKLTGKQQGEEGEEPREQGHEFYVISPTSGLLAPGDVAKVAITFAAR